MSVDKVDWEKLAPEVEAVARAMYVARVGDCRNCYEFDELNSEGQHHVYESLIIEAKAAIQALAFPAIKAEREALVAENERLREALKPFAKMKPVFAEDEDDIGVVLALGDDQLGSTFHRPLAMLDKARAALKPTPGGTDS
ncbi:MAG: hypothetical protein ABJL57_03295 [Hyphomonas sp.]|uniref:hypothetical protein n=1 Tax=Hyphomonas sp. TaxID=87 RepID=UPI0032641BB4